MICLFILGTVSHARVKVPAGWDFCWFYSLCIPRTQSRVWQYMFIECRNEQIISVPRGCISPAAPNTLLACQCPLSLGLAGQTSTPHNPCPTSPVPSTASVSCPNALWKAGKGRKRKAQVFPSLGTSFAFLSLPTGHCCGLGCIQALIWDNLSGSIRRVTIPSGTFPLWLVGIVFSIPCHLWKTKGSNRERSRKEHGRNKVSGKCMGLCVVAYSIWVQKKHWVLCACVWYDPQGEKCWGLMIGEARLAFHLNHMCWANGPKSHIPTPALFFSSKRFDIYPAYCPWTVVMSRAFIKLKTHGSTIHSNLAFPLNVIEV